MLNIKKISKIPLLAVSIVLMAIFVIAGALLGDHIFDSSFAVTPEAVLSDDFNFSQLLYSDTNIECPSGFTKISNYCDLNNSSKIQGWLIVDFTADGNAVMDVNRVNASVSDLNLGCTDCNVGMKVNVYTTPDLDANSIQWTLRAGCKIADNAIQVSCASNFSPQAVEGVLVGRGVYQDSWADPAIHIVSIFNN